MAWAVLADSTPPEPQVAPPAGWPQAWRQLYSDFEAFIELRERVWPRTGLTIDSTGATTLGPPPIEPDKPSGIQTFVRGIDSGFSAFKARPKDSRSDGARSSGRMVVRSGRMEAIAGPGVYGCVYRAASRVGYQHYPPLWTVRAETGPEGKMRWTRLDPEDPEQFWPNWRGLLFRDYHVLLDVHINDIYARNRRANPAVFLQVDSRGKLMRELLPPDAEQWLKWRIYRNGIRVEGGPAQGQAELACRHGAGLYVAFLAIEGPSGSLPVSNIVPFYLHPEIWPDGEPRIYPRLSSRAEVRWSQPWSDLPQSRLPQMECPWILPDAQPSPPRGN